MKIRNHRKRTWLFIPVKDSLLKPKTFFYKKSLIRYLNSDLANAVNGRVQLNESGFSYSTTIRSWDVWIDEYKRGKNGKVIAQLRQQYWRGSRWGCKNNNVSKASKKWFAFSDKVNNSMAVIYKYTESNNPIPQNLAKKLEILFYKRGFKDWEADSEQLDYIQYHITEGIPFSHWSDRCNLLRTKTILHYFRQLNLI